MMYVGVVFGVTEKQTVAVYITGEVDAGYKRVIGAKMVSAITQDEKYAAVERTNDFLKELGKEQSFIQTGYVDDNMIINLGKQFGANFVCIVDISKIFDLYFIVARLIDVKTGIIAASADRNGDIKNMTDLNDISESVASGLISSAAGCTGKDKQVGIKGCCVGLVIIDGICRELPGFKNISTEMLHNIEYFSIKTPPGYRLPNEDEAKELFKYFNTKLWTNKTEFRPYWSDGKKNYKSRSFNNSHTRYYIYEHSGIKLGAYTGYSRKFQGERKSKYLSQYSDRALALFVPDV